MTSVFAHDIDAYLATLKATLDEMSRPNILAFLETLLAARERGSRIFIMGNGGSAATASHFVCDFNKGLSRPDQKRFRFVCLNDNVPSLMAYANDLAYDDIFVEQLKNFLQPGDVVIGISGSGNSANVVNAIAYARAQGCQTIALTGFDGGRLKEMADQCVHVAVNNMQIVEDAHMIVDHMSMSILAGGVHLNPQEGGR